VPPLLIDKSIKLGELSTVEAEFKGLRRGNYSDNKKFVEFFAFAPVTFSEGIPRPGALLPK